MRGHLADQKRCVDSVLFTHMGAGRVAMQALIEAVTPTGIWKLVSRIFVENTASRTEVTGNLPSRPQAAGRMSRTCMRARRSSRRWSLRTGHQS